MEELINNITIPNVFAQIQIQEPGIDLSFCAKIIDTTIFEDGITLYLDGESEIFISSLLNEIIGIEGDGDPWIYTLKTQTGTLLTITVGI